ncbi:hypothetical protein FHG64_05310 [Antarcticibacterium flavum]|uniref:PorT family protein n=1 Tax=Antarcticibacterium flavum TaxID=2058175 RepID=A0A5B7WZV8_9FLAO|nr:MULTISPECIES: hypothetical protein [Antarcticibacterium]MCM4159863.1 hypothetical protein [Antarcticibacterium sp. W02-3]QCY68864.1 hypothetical protein FHG64_05310 [Antarcticibacterium flavum]
MKTIITYILITFISLLFSNLMAQTDSIPANREPQSIENIEYFNREKEKIIQEEKEQLKLTIEGINYRLEREMISVEKANELKQKAAEKHARNIENRITILENKLALEERNRDFENRLSLFDSGKIVNISMRNNSPTRKYDKRTTSDLVLAVGFNNALTSGSSIDESDFKLAGSRFFEIGWAWKTRVFDNSNFLRLKYGVSFQFNGLKPTDNRFFVTDGGLTTLEEYPIELDKSKFRMDNLVFPLHFEFGPSKKIERKDYIRYSTAEMIKIGIGGYAGFNIGDRQKLKYRENGDKVKEKLKGDYNTNEFIYGVSGYLSLGSTALYVKYDLNPIFKDPNIEMRNVSVGLRFDVD